MRINYFMSSRMIFYKCIRSLVAALLLPLIVHAQAPASTPFKDPESCLKCHQELIDEKVIHQAVKDACLDCHSEMDPASRPHKYKNNSKFGLGAEGTELCEGCHGKIVGKKKNRHKAMDKNGCIACHQPHASKNDKLLKAPVPSMCKRCHEKTNFDGAVVHKPVQEAKCAGCHDPHASDNPSLLAKTVSASCVECHKEIKEGSHVVSGFNRKGHPLGIDGAPFPDTQRPGKFFNCVSCHEPHAGPFVKLVRIDPKLGMAACQKCHDK
jgi:predicted CXXCH cytochrome family protein